MSSKAQADCSTSRNESDASIAVLHRDVRDGIEVLEVQDRGRLWTAYHDTFTFCHAQVQLTGQSWVYRRNTYSATLETTMLIEPGEIHRTTRGGEASFHLLFVRPTFFQSVFGGAQIHFREGQVSAPTVRHAFRSLCNACNSRSSRLVVDELVVTFLGEATRTSAEFEVASRSTSCDRSVRLVVDCLQSRYVEDLRLDELAAMVDLTKFHLCRTFAAQTGTSIHRYRNLIRLNKAKAMLLGSEPLSQIAQAVGFYDQSHFTNSFRSVYGIAPSAYRTMSARAKSPVSP